MKLLTVPGKRNYWLYQANKRYGKTVPGKWKSRLTRQTEILTVPDKQTENWLYQAIGNTDCTRQTNGKTDCTRQTEKLTVLGKRKNLLYQANENTDCTRQTEIVTVPGKQKNWLYQANGNSDCTWQTNGKKLYQANGNSDCTRQTNGKVVPGKQKYWLTRQTEKLAVLGNKRENWLY